MEADGSLFYGDRDALTSIRDTSKRIPGELYGSIVEHMPIVCVDIVLVSRVKGVMSCLLVLRDTEPAKGLWWLPGGRIWKGETFFAAAARKAFEETGCSADPSEVLFYANTVRFPRTLQECSSNMCANSNDPRPPPSNQSQFFPTSAHAAAPQWPWATPCDQR